MRIRTARRNRQLSLAEAARAAGISASFLASVERGVSGVSVQTLNRLADVLNMPPSAFAPSPGLRSSRVRPDERARTVLEGGVTWEELVTPWHNLEPALLIVPPGASSGGPITRPGEIFVFAMSGTLWFELLDEDAQVVTEPGDALVLEAGSTWSWENNGPVEATVLWVEQLPPGAWTPRETSGDDALSTNTQQARASSQQYSSRRRGRARGQDSSRR
jgi:transcriptional regulator with XRE-family HTH domain